MHPFFQSVFHHRYAAHNLFTMSRFWEKVFYFGCFITQGSSYISAYTYGLMHRLHHAHTDKPEDPHSPHNDPNPFVMMWTTRNNYFNLYIGERSLSRICKNSTRRRTNQRPSESPWLSEKEVVEKVLLKKQAVKSFIPVEKIAELFLFLASDNAQAVSGIVFTLDGACFAQ